MNTMNSKLTTSRAQGFALLETLIAFIVMAVGLLALLSFHGESQKNISDAKAQAEAVAIAEEKLQEMESFLANNDPRLAIATSTDSYSGVNAVFTRIATVLDPTTTNTAISQVKAAQVLVQWQDRNGESQEVLLRSDMYTAHPSDSLANFMQVVASTSGASNLWGNTDTDTDTDTDTATGTGTQTGVETQTGTDTSTDTDIQLTEIVVHIIGDLAGATAADLDLVLFTVAEVDPLIDGYYDAECVIDSDEKGFACDLIYTNNLNGWSGTVSLQTNKYFCSVTGSGAQLTTMPSQSVTLTYANLLTDKTMVLNVKSNSICN